MNNRKTRHCLQLLTITLFRFVYKVPLTAVCLDPTTFLILVRLSLPVKLQCRHMTITVLVTLHQAKLVLTVFRVTLLP
jgi:hypothetical protein